MSSFVSKTFGNLIKILITLSGLILVFYVLIEFRLWSGNWTGYFLRRGAFEEIIFVSLIVAGISTVVLWLFKWHLKIQGR